MKRLIGFLGWFGVALVAAAVVIRFTRPEWMEWSQRLAIAGLVATLLYTMGQWRDIARDTDDIIWLSDLWQMPV